MERESTASEFCEEPCYRAIKFHSPAVHFEFTLQRVPTTTPENRAEEPNRDFSDHETAVVREDANEDNASGTRSNVRSISDEDLISQD